MPGGYGGGGGVGGGDGGLSRRVHALHALFAEKLRPDVATFTWQHKPHGAPACLNATYTASGYAMSEAA